MYQQNSEETFLTLADSIPQLLWMTDPEAWIYWYNQRWYNYTGKTFEDMQGWGWMSVHHPDLVESVTEKFKASLLTGEPWEDTFLLRGKDGEFRWFLSRALPVKDEHGKITKWIGTNTDISEQHKTEQALKKAKNELEFTFSNIPFGIFQYDKSGKIIFVNDNGAKQMGFETAEEVLSEKFLHKLKERVNEVYEILDEKGKPLPLDQFSTAITLKTLKSAEVLSNLVNKQSKESAYFLSKSSPLFDENGDLVMVLTTSTDITFQKTTQETLRYRKALLEAHIEANLDGILLVDARGKILSYNHGFINIWNMPQYIVDASDDEAALTFAMSQLVNPQQFIEKVKYLYDHPKEISIDELEFKNGNIVERYGYPVVADDGTYYAWSWTFRDITDKKLIEKDLKESEAQFRQIADFLPAKISNTDGDVNANYYNQSWYDYTGVSHEELKNSGWIKFVHPDDLHETENSWNLAQKTGNDFEIELRFLDRNGEYKWHLGRAKAVKDSNGNIIKWISILTEIQKIKDEEQRKNEFIKMVSHELKTPITSIKGYVQFLLKSINQEQIIASKSVSLKSSLSRIDAQVVRLTKLISEILDLSRLEESKLDLKSEWFNLKDLIDSTVQDILFTNSRLTIQVNHEISPEIFGDKDRIEQVLINLITNAIKYAPNSSLVEVLVKQAENNMVSVSIRDFGIGIDKDDQLNIFNRFYRVEGKIETKFSGFGIGLFIVKEIVNRHNGNINVESEKGVGSTFTFTLPLSTKQNS